MAWINGLLRKIRDNRGSSIVEAAVVYPIAVLICVGIISAGLAASDHVQEDSLKHRDDVLSDLKGRLISCENSLRGVWILEK